MRQLLVAVGLCMLAACGSSSTGEKADKVAPEDKAAAEQAKGSVPAGFNYLDACSVVGKDLVAKAVGSAVSSTELSEVNPVGNMPAGFSNCEYKLADGRSVTVLTHYAPDGEDIAYAYATALKQSKEMGMVAEEVAGVGKAAYYNPASKSLSVFAEPTKFYVFGLGLAKTPDPEAKAQMIALAKAQGL